jgi:hypothetical protein
MSDIHIIKNGRKAFVIPISEAAKVECFDFVNSENEIGYPFWSHDWDEEIESGIWIKGLTVKLIEE